MGFCAAFEFVAERFGCGAWSEAALSDVVTPMPAIASWSGLAGGVLHNSVASPLLGGGRDWDGTRLDCGFEGGDAGRAGL